MENRNYWQEIWVQLKSHPLGKVGLFVFFLFVFVGLYAPFFASSKPIFVQFEGEWYFPLFRYLFYTGFFTKRLDIFFNLLMFTIPAYFFVLYFFKSFRSIFKWASLAFLFTQTALFIYLIMRTPEDPATDLNLVQARQVAIEAENKKIGHFVPSWQFDLKFMNGYARLNMVIREILRKSQNEHLKKYETTFQDEYHQPFPTLWNLEQLNIANELKQLNQTLEASVDKPDSSSYQQALAKKNYILDRQAWLNEESQKIKYLFLPLVRHFHWEDDAGGSQSLNQVIPWTELSRVNRKDLMAALIFGIRISLSVGIIAVGIALLIGIPIGAFSGYYGGVFDIITSRLLEIWESMPTFFMLLIVVAMMQSKSIFIVILVIGFFGWTSFTRYIRGEFFKQRNLPYVEACKAQGFSDLYIIFSHILPNSIAPILTLLSFSIMGAITSEAGLSFLGLGEEGSCSWGVLMDEGRSAFPSESYLLWPPAILLTILLVAIALVGDALRDAIDPKMRRT